MRRMNLVDLVVVFVLLALLVLAANKEFERLASRFPPKAGHAASRGR